MSNRKTDTRIKILTATWHLLEERRGQGVNMRTIAETVGISRQALYLHFGSRTELMIATLHYVDEVKGLNKSLEQLQKATTGVELLETLVEVWGNHIPEIHGLAKAFFNTRETDEATAAAWDEGMACLYDLSQTIVEKLENEGMLTERWSSSEAVELLWTMISIQNWEQLTVDCGWSTAEYIIRMKILLKCTFVK